jgi:hypothetical protein
VIDEVVEGQDPLLALEEGGPSFEGRGPILGPVIEMIPPVDDDVRRRQDDEGGQDPDEALVNFEVLRL